MFICLIDFVFILIYRKIIFITIIIYKMADLKKIGVSLLEGLAVTGAIYLITKKQLQMTELATLALSIGVTFLILDLFAPRIGASARQGAGFGLGAPLVGYGSSLSSQQFGGNPTPLPAIYFGAGAGGVPQSQQSQKPAVVEGMDDPMAIQYYQSYNPPTSANEPQFQRQYKIPLPADQAPVGVSTTDSADYYRIDGSENIDVQSASIPSPIAKQLQENPFNTLVRSVTEIRKPGNYYYQSNIPKAQPLPAEVYPDPILYNPLKPQYGYRQDLPKGW